jgi:hypothetical protein
MTANSLTYCRALEITARK